MFFIWNQPVIIGVFCTIALITGIKNGAHYYLTVLPENYPKYLESFGKKNE